MLALQRYGSISVLLLLYTGKHQGAEGFLGFAADVLHTCVNIFYKICETGT